MKVGDLVRYKPHYSCEGKIGMLLELLPKEDLDSEFAWKVIWLDNQMITTAFGFSLLVIDAEVI